MVRVYCGKVLPPLVLVPNIEDGVFSFHREAGVISLSSFAVVKFVFSLCLSGVSLTRLEHPQIVSRRTYVCHTQGLAKFRDTCLRICRFGHDVILLILQYLRYTYI